MRLCNILCHIWLTFGLGKKFYLRKFSDKKKLSNAAHCMTHVFRHTPTQQATPESISPTLGEFLDLEYFSENLDLEKIFTLENFLIKKSSLMQPTGSTSFDTPQQQATSESISPTLGEFKHHHHSVHPSFHSNTPHTNL